jgi:hypothetical protein
MRRRRWRLTSPRAQEQGATSAPARCRLSSERTRRAAAFIAVGANDSLADSRASSGHELGALGRALCRRCDRCAVRRLTRWKRSCALRRPDGCWRSGRGRADWSRALPNLLSRRDAVKAKVIAELRQNGLPLDRLVGTAIHLDSDEIATTTGAFVLVNIADARAAANAIELESLSLGAPVDRPIKRAEASVCW